MADESYGFEQARVRLEEIVSQVRKKDTSLERSLDLLEEGVRLANTCTELVDHTEWRSVASELDERAEAASADAETVEDSTSDDSGGAGQDAGVASAGDAGTAGDPGTAEQAGTDAEAGADPGPMKAADIDDAEVSDSAAASAVDHAADEGPESRIYDHESDDVAPDEPTAAPDACDGDDRADAQATAG